MVRGHTASLLKHLAQQQSALQQAKACCGLMADSCSTVASHIPPCPASPAPRLPGGSSGCSALHVALRQLHSTRCRQPAQHFDWHPHSEATLSLQSDPPCSWTRAHSAAPPLTPSAASSSRIVQQDPLSCQHGLMGQQLSTCHTPASWGCSQRRSYTGGPSRLTASDRPQQQQPWQGPPRPALPGGPPRSPPGPGTRAGPRPQAGGPRQGGGSGGGGGARLTNDKRTMPEKQDKPKANEEIRAAVVRLVLADGSHKVLQRDEALAEAKALGQDLVMVNPAADPPVCRLHDVHKLVFAQRQKAKEMKRKVLEQRRKDVTKELRFTSQSAEHDVNTKLSQGLAFLEKGNRVKLTVNYPGARGQAGAQAMMDRLLEVVRDKAIVVPPKPTEKRPRNTFSVLLLPLSDKQ